MIQEPVAREPTVGDPTAHLHARIAELERAVHDADAELAVLRTSEAELRAMFRAMTDLVLVIDRDGRYLRIADTAPDLLYRPSGTLLGQRMHDVMPLEMADSFLQHVHQALDGQTLVRLDYDMKIEDRVVWFSASISPMAADVALIVCRDVTERRHHEQLLRANLRQQEQLRQQEAALLQLSTPLIPIGADIVVMPLIGQLDTTRAQLVMETLLHGVERTRVRVAILDITGVAAIDATVAAALLQSARAVKLLGASVMLTGIRPDVAATLVALGVDLSGVDTRGTLADAIRDAQAPARPR